MPDDLAAMLSDLIARLVAHAETDLRENLLPYWIRTAPDPERGGFVGRVGQGEVVDPDAARGALLTSRILWTFAAAHQRWPDAGYLGMADRACHDLLDRFWDEANGGLHWTVTADGKPLDTSRNVYGQAFGIYALSEYHRATGNPEALERAVILYRLIDTHACDTVNRGYFELFTADWQRGDSTSAAVMDVGHGAKSQNTHLHLMEAFTNLLAVWPDEGLREAQHDLVDLMMDRVLDQTTGHLNLFFDEAWNVLSTGISYGHDIEAGWLILQAAELLGEKVQIARARHAAVQIAEATLSDGVGDDGSILYAGEPSGPTDGTRDWWPQAEAVVGFLNAWQVSGDGRFLAAAGRVWDFIERELVDHEKGGWFRSIAPEGGVIPTDKINLWICPYHNGRADMEIIDRLGPLIAGVAESP